MRLLGLSGSLRAGSSNAALLRATAALMPEGIDFAFCEKIAELPHFNPDLDGEGATAPPLVAAFRAELGAAAGVVISCPEYAHGVPGSFKNALDWIVSSGELRAKPVLLLTPSTGGQWARDSLVATLTVMEAQVILSSLELTRKSVGKTGAIEDLTLAQAIRASLDQLLSAIRSTSHSEGLGRLSI